MKINDVSVTPAKVDYSSQSQSQPRVDKSIIQSERVKTSSQISKNQSKVSSVSGGLSLKNDEEIADKELFQKSVAQANRALKPSNRFIERNVHEVTHTVMYTLKDSTTGEVISEFPPKKIQDMIAKMWELAGLFVDEQA